MKRAPIFEIANKTCSVGNFSERVVSSRLTYGIRLAGRLTGACQANSVLHTYYQRWTIDSLVKQMTRPFRLKVASDCCCALHCINLRPRPPYFLNAGSWVRRLLLGDLEDIYKVCIYNTLLLNRKKSIVKKIQEFVTKKFQKYCAFFDSPY